MARSLNAATARERLESLYAAHNRRGAAEATAGVRAIAPDDPARYDFGLMHLRLRGNGRLSAFIEGLAPGGSI